MLPPLQRTLYRELLRATQRIASASHEQAIPSIGRGIARIVGEASSVGGKELAMVCQGYNAAHWRTPLPASLIRRAYRNTASSSRATDDALAALRGLNEVTSWLEFNRRLHDLAGAGTVLDGACIVADGIEASATAAQDLYTLPASVADELDKIAANVVHRRSQLLEAEVKRFSPLLCERLLTVHAMNEVLFEDLGYAGEYGDVCLNSSVRHALVRRRGLPITLCVLYLAVAERVGLQCAVHPTPGLELRVPSRFTPAHSLLTRPPFESSHGQFTNFPNRTLLRLEGASGCERSDGQDTSTASEARTLSAEEAAEAAEAAEMAEAAGAEAEAAEAVETEVVRRIPTSMLVGVFTAHYGSHGPEVVEVSLRDGTLEAVKITGDAHVPAGRQTWRVTGAGASEEVVVGETLPAAVQVAGVGFANPREVHGSLRVQSSSTLLLQVEEETPSSLVFSRCGPSDPLYIDAFAGGKLLPAASCRQLLQRARVAPDQADEWLAPVSAPQVWARMCRNLAMHARSERQPTMVRFWEGVGCALDVPPRALSLTDESEE